MNDILIYYEILKYFFIVCVKLQKTVVRIDSGFLMSVYNQYQRYSNPTPNNQSQQT